MSTSVNRRGGDAGRRSRQQFKEFLVMGALLLPGLGLLMLGFRLLRSAGGLSVPGSLLAALGGCLVVTGGYYHYRKDYSHMPGRRGMVVFLLVTALSALAGALATGTLFRLIAGR